MKRQTPRDCAQTPQLQRLKDARRASPAKSPTPVRTTQEERASPSTPQSQVPIPPTAAPADVMPELTDWEMTPSLRGVPEAFSQADPVRRFYYPEEVQQLDITNINTDLASPPWLLSSPPHRVSPNGRRRGAGRGSFAAATGGAVRLVSPTHRGGTRPLVALPTPLVVDDEDEEIMMTRQTRPCTREELRVQSSTFPTWTSSMTSAALATHTSAFADSGSHVSASVPLLALVDSPVSTTSTTPPSSPNVVATETNASHSEVHRAVLDEPPVVRTETSTTTATSTASAHTETIVSPTACDQPVASETCQREDACRVPVEPILTSSQVSPSVSSSARSTPERWRPTAHALAASRAAGTQMAKNEVRRRRQQVKAYVLLNLVPDLSDIVPGSALSNASLVKSATAARTAASSTPRHGTGENADNREGDDDDGDNDANVVRLTSSSASQRGALPTRISPGSTSLTTPHTTSRDTETPPTKASAPTVALKSIGHGAAGVAKGVVPRATLGILFQRVGAPRTADEHRAALSQPCGTVTWTAATRADASAQASPSPHAHSRQTFYVLPPPLPVTVPATRTQDDAEHPVVREVVPPEMCRLPFSPPVDLSRGGRDRTTDATHATPHGAFGAFRESLAYNVLPHPKERAMANAKLRSAADSAQASLFIWSGRATTTIDDDGADILPKDFAPIRRRRGLRLKAAKKATTRVPVTHARAAPERRLSVTTASSCGLHALYDSCVPTPRLFALEVYAGRVQPLPPTPAPPLEPILGDEVAEQRRERVTYHAYFATHACCTTDTITHDTEDREVQLGAHHRDGDVTPFHAHEPQETGCVRFYYDDPPRTALTATEEVASVPFYTYTAYESLVTPAAAAPTPTDTEGGKQPEALVYTRETRTVPPPAALRGYEWEATRLRSTKAVAHEWHRPLCTVQCGPALEALLCAPCQLSRQCNRLNYNHPRILWPLCLMMFCLDPCTCLRCSSGVACLNRSSIRARYGISGSFIEDGAAACLCTPCTTQQNLLEMQHNGDCPGGWCFLPVVNAAPSTVTMM